MRYASLFTGIGGFDLGFDHAGMECILQCEQDSNCLKLLDDKWPTVKKVNDVKKIETVTTNVVVGGFPCQDVSMAGKRAGLAGKQSGLWFEFHRIIERNLPRWVVIENVPGLLSSNGGQDFATILRGLVECGYGVVWRILDAQYFGLAQRRRRVFIVGSLGNGRSAQVLFESEGVPRDTPPSRETGQKVARPIAFCTTTNHGDESQQEYIVFQKNQRNEVRDLGDVTGVPASQPGMKQQTFIARSLTSRNERNDGDTENFVIAIDVRNSIEQPDGISGTLQAKKTGGYSLNYTNPIAFAWQQGAGKNDRSYPVRAGDYAGSITESRIDAIAGEFGVRRLTPTECERLQGFPDGYTEGFSDSVRYRMLGNAVTVPCAEWIAKRILLSG